eukprot:TRINITY_DN26753_c0_g1_i5.p1 TRINITY_DN26753_c0_g1~~TRINITY_DN26753_c0_g1_i5.p1  ORF type:complete len:370 (-),score=-56.06 TRINITY_DN26753_c0_g1_i5:1109-2218(-)
MIGTTSILKSRENYWTQKIIRTIWHTQTDGALSYPHKICCAEIKPTCLPVSALKHSSNVCRSAERLLQISLAQLINCNFVNLFAHFESKHNSCALVSDHSFPIPLFQVKFMNPRNPEIVGVSLLYTSFAHTNPLSVYCNLSRLSTVYYTHRIANFYPLLYQNKPQNSYVLLSLHSHFHKQPIISTKLELFMQILANQEQKLTNSDMINPKPLFPAYSSLSVSSFSELVNNLYKVPIASDITNQYFDKLQQMQIVLINSYKHIFILINSDLLILISYCRKIQFYRKIYGNPFKTQSFYNCRERLFCQILIQINRIYQNSQFLTSRECHCTFLQNMKQESEYNHLQMQSLSNENRSLILCNNQNAEKTPEF